mmetsp:Transcript_74172/g.197802  ORF Transcript_74172/g.197802 Transcript_74172/m.197802 type:complete len:227 (+) Transcript_74172:1856-2536(+)
MSDKEHDQGVEDVNVDLFPKHQHPRRSFGLRPRKHPPLARKRLDPASEHLHGGLPSNQSSAPGHASGQRRPRRPPRRQPGRRRGLGAQVESVPPPQVQPLPCLLHGVPQPPLLLVPAPAGSGSADPHVQGQLDREREHDQRSAGHHRATEAQRHGRVAVGLRPRDAQVAWGALRTARGRVGGGDSPARGAGDRRGGPGRAMEGSDGAGLRHSGAALAVTSGWAVLA